MVISLSLYLCLSVSLSICLWERVQLCKGLNGPTHGSDSLLLTKTDTGSWPWLGHHVCLGNILALERVRVSLVGKNGPERKLVCFCTEWFCEFWSLYSTCHILLWKMWIRMLSVSFSWSHLIFLPPSLWTPDSRYYSCLCFLEHTLFLFKMVSILPHIRLIIIIVDVSKPGELPE